MKKIVLSLGLATALLVGCQGPQNQERNAQESGDTTQAGQSQKSPIPEVPPNGEVFFANLENGDTVQSPLFVEFGIEGMEVEPAGKANAGKGHHHIIIDGDYLPRGSVVPADSVNIHYGGGQTNDTLDLSPGKHRLTMQFADGYHRSYGRTMSKEIHVYVKAEEDAENGDSPEEAADQE